MNDDRRKELRAIAVLISQARERMQAAANAEQKDYENLAERVRVGNRGQWMHEMIEELATMAAELESVLIGIDEVCEVPQ